jgi:hypothetical protein
MGDIRKGVDKIMQNLNAEVTVINDLVNRSYGAAFFMTAK